LASVRRKSSQHLINDASKAPPVDSFTVAELLDDFWRQVLRSAANGHGLLVIMMESLGKSEISKLDVPGPIEKDIFRFQTGLIKIYSR
jgi:hypothetical protein